MAYKYEFDHTPIPSPCYSRDDYEIIQSAVKLLEGKLSSWNKVAMDHGALEPPYSREVEKLRDIIDWGDAELKKEHATTIYAGGRGISIGNIRYLKAALVYAAWHKEEEAAEKAKDTWPSTVQEAVRGIVRQYHRVAETISYPPAGILDDLRPEYGITKPDSSADTNWDAFISHASEDKDAFARPLAEALRALDLSIWYDEFTLTLGDSLRRSIDRGLARSRFGVVVLSPNFFAKEWPQKELDGLVAREVRGKKVILPVWHNIDEQVIRKFSPMLADRVAVSSRNGIKAVVDAIIAGMRA